MIHITISIRLLCILRSIGKRITRQTSTTPQSPGTSRQLIEIDPFCPGMQSRSTEKDIKPAGPRHRNKKQQVDNQSKIDQEVSFKRHIADAYAFYMSIDIPHIFFLFPAKYREDLLSS